MTDAEITALAVDLGARLAARRALCVTAESCTGGLVAGAITDVAGSSAWFDRGFVTYSNEAKMELLGVPAATLAQHGAVSEAIARAMAEGALARSRASVAVAITGIAGPGGGSPEKPVGTVCFAWAVRDAPDAGGRPAASTAIASRSGAPRSSRRWPDCWRPSRRCRKRSADDCALRRAAVPVHHPGATTTEWSDMTGNDCRRLPKSGRAMSAGAQPSVAARERSVASAPGSPR